MIMSEYFRVLRKVGVLAFALLIALPGCTRGPGEIPITTQSDEARKIFLEARQLAENLRSDEARVLFDQALEKDPEFALAHMGRALNATSVTDSRGHLDRAMALAADVSEDEKLFIEAYHAIFLENNPDKALLLRKRLVGRHPNDKRAHFVLGQSYAGRNKFDKAIAEYEKAIDIDEDYAPPYNSLGYTYMAKGEYDQTREAFRNYIRLIPGEANPYDSMADLLTRMGRHEEAIEHFQKAAELNPKFAFSQRKIGLNLVYLGRHDEGRAAYAKAIGMETTAPGKVFGMQMTAFSYLDEGNYPQALAEMDECIQMATETNLPYRLALLHSGACRIHVEMGNLNQAEESLASFRGVVEESDLSSADKDDFARLALFQEAVLASEGADFEGALDKAKELKANIEAGEDPAQMESYHLLLGYIYLEQGKSANAIENLQQADQQDPFPIYLLAVAESEAGNEAKAAELFREVAQWNEVLSQSFGNLHRALGYALVRSKATAAVE